MSKLVNAIYTEKGQRTPVRAAVLDALTVNASIPTIKLDGLYAYEYRIGVSLQHRVVLTDTVMQQSNSAALTDAIAAVKDAVIEEVFGEFRPHFRAVELALWNRDMDAALAALRTMERQMFSADIT